MKRRSKREGRKREKGGWGGREKEGKKREWG